MKWVCPTPGCGHTEDQPMAVEIWHNCEKARRKVQLKKIEHVEDSGGKHSSRAGSSTKPRR